MKARKKIDKVLNNISNKLRLYELVNNNSGMGVVEIILIIFFSINWVSSDFQNADNEYC